MSMTPTIAEASAIMKPFPAPAASIGDMNTMPSSIEPTIMTNAGIATSRRRLRSMKPRGEPM